MASRQLPGGTGFRATLTAVSAVLIAALFAMSLSAFVTPTVADTSADMTNAVLLDPAAEPVQHTRQLPIFSDAARMDDVVVDGVVDPTAMQFKLMELARPLDYDAWVWNTITTMRHIATPREGQWGAGRIPYSHPDLEWSLEYYLAIVNTLEREQLLDLTSALIIAEAGVSEVDLGLVMAELFLQRYAIQDQSCDVQLQLLYAYTLGGTPVLADVDQVTRTTIAACPEDPTPYWLMAQLASRMALTGQTNNTAADSLAFADQYFGELRELFPDSPLGYAGAADLLMDRAEEVRSRGLRPFQARAWEREALGLYEQARAISDDPQLLIGHARALMVLGHADAAAEAVAQLPPNLAATPGAAVIAIRQAQSSGSFDDVVDRVANVTTPPDPLRVYALDNSRLRSLERLSGVQALMVDASHRSMGGADIDDVSFIPSSRRNYLSRGCLDQDLLNALTLMGGDYSGWQAGVANLPRSLACLAENTDPVGYANTYDVRQDLQRWAGDFAAADATLTAWEQEFPLDFAAPQRRGEVAYLLGDYDVAADHFRAAWELLAPQLDPANPHPMYDTISGVTWDAVQPPVLVHLQLAAAESAAGNRTEALNALHAAQDRCQVQNTLEFDAERFYVLAQLGAWYLDEGDYDHAVENYLAALPYGVVPQVLPSHSGDTYVTLLRGAQENNAALALSQLGRHDEAIGLATAALGRDTASPIFLDTLAYTLQRAGRTEEAGQWYRDALAGDATSYVSANNLAVLLAQAGQAEQAHALLSGAVQAQPDYAIGWHNLGVVSAQLSPMWLVFSEQAMAKAVRLDAGMRGHGSELIPDEAIYSSGLDISKALSPDWTFAATAQAPDRFAWTMVILLVLQLARAFGVEHVVTSAAERIAQRTTGRLRSQSWMRAPVGVALTASAVVLGLAASLGAGSAARGLVYGLTAAALVVFPWGVRVLRGKAGVVHYGSTPAVGFGVAGLALGLTIAPLPGVRPVPGRRASSWVLWLPALLVGGLGIAFAVVAATSGSPTARFFTMSSAALLGAMMLPFPPFDGAWQRNRVVSLAVAIALGAVSVALGLNWI